VNDKTIVKLVDNLRQQIIDEQKRSQQFAIDLKEIHDRQRKLDESLKSPSKARRSKKQKMGALTSVPIDIVEIKKT
jgi:ferritin-like metal-binding protein YciE